MRKISIIILVAVFTSVNVCFSQRDSEQCPRKILPKSTACIPEHSDHLEYNGTAYPLIILVTESQTKNNLTFDEGEQNVSHGPNLLNPDDLKQALHGIFDKFEQKSSVFRIDIVSMDNNGFIALKALARKIEIKKFDIESNDGESFPFLPYEKLRDVLPESAFDCDGNILYWGYSSHVRYGGGSNPTRLEHRVSYKNNGKDQFVADLVNYMFTWLEQDDRRWSPLSPRGTDKLKNFIEFENDCGCVLVQEP